MEGGGGGARVAEGIGGRVCVGGGESKVLLEVGCAVGKVVADDVDELELPRSVLSRMT